MTTRTLINIAAIIELLAGLATLVMPEYLIELLLGGGLNETGIVVTRVLGIGLFSLGVSVWALPQQNMKPFRPSAKQTLKNYYENPTDILEDQEELIFWALEAVQVTSNQK